MDTSGYQVSDLDDFEFYWENDQLHVYAVPQPGIDTPFSPTALDDLEMGGSGENHILLDDWGQAELYSNKTSLWETNTTPCLAEKSSTWDKTTQYSWLCLQIFVPISITVYVFWYKL